MFPAYPAEKSAVFRGSLGYGRFQPCEVHLYDFFVIHGDLLCLIGTFTLIDSKSVFRLRCIIKKQKKSADGVSAVNSNELAERLGKSAFYSAEIIGENILRSMLAR